VKLYYTDPLAAAYMAKEFGVKFSAKLWEHREIVEDLFDAYDFIRRYEAQLSSEQPNGPLIYIHPDSYHIFEPQDGDWGRTSSGYWCYYEKDNESWWMAGHGLTRVEDDLVKIIQRNHKPFFMPESDDE